MRCLPFIWQISTGLQENLARVGSWELAVSNVAAPVGQLKCLDRFQGSLFYLFHAEISDLVVLDAAPRYPARSGLEATSYKSTSGSFIVDFNACNCVKYSIPMYLIDIGN